MTIYEAIQEELTIHLEALDDSKLPQSFEISLDEVDFLALLSQVVNSETKQRLPVDTKRLRLKMLGYEVIVMRGGAEMRPEGWVDA